MLNLPVRLGVRDGCPIDPDVLFIAELNEFPAGELCVLVYVMEFGTPKQWMMSRKNKMACSDLIAEIGRASIHFVNFVNVTSKCV